MSSKTLTRLFASLLALAISQATAAFSIPPPDVKAEGYILIDVQGGDVLAEKNADKPLEPASLTKIMTAYVVFHELKEGNIKLQDLATISEAAWRTGGSKMFVEVGKQVSIEDLIMGMVIQSGNDASLALAEHIGGNMGTFARLMNEHAKRLGMTNSNFLNPEGLPEPNHLTTARDLAKLTAAMIREFPEYYAWFAIKEFTYHGITQPNRNNLLWKDPSVDGVKTGHTEAAGYCLVASSKREDTRLVSVLLGAKSIKQRESESQALLNYGFNFFENSKVLAANQPAGKATLWKGEKATVDAGVAKDLLVTLPRRQKKKLETVLKLADHIEAPITKGTAVGEIEVMIDGKLVKTAPLIALEDVKEGGIFTRMADGLILWFKK
ncbi:MAG: D-alanyl-D-alanine carboxypeptidase [Gammaproteobacteria bacterium]|nr:D-alanyl-D-alanine carboxypeptidase [Gammaproteobacteria bacterium]MBU1653288.1 D-alanyl-D-alanine carboxypeptidase [Gammaproteobacteria bacterium]MBU1961514.1 D-alanyl-D-alanine carboxypeptidase [Gammaproteobacteria bacterium]